MKLSKCQFHVMEIEFLEFRISIESVFMKSDCVKIIVEWPELQSVKDIQVFLGFANFYRRFIRGYFCIVGSMIIHLKIKSVKNSVQGQSGSEETEMRQGSQVLKFFVLSTETRLAFKNLKQTFLVASILHHFDQKHSIRVETDASGFAISGILTQCEENEKPKQHWLPVTF